MKSVGEALDFARLEAEPEGDRLQEEKRLKEEEQGEQWADDDVAVLSEEESGWTGDGAGGSISLSTEEGITASLVL